MKFANLIQKIFLFEKLATYEWDLDKQNEFEPLYQDGDSDDQLMEVVRPMISESPFYHYMVDNYYGVDPSNPKNFIVDLDFAVEPNTEGVVTIDKNQLDAIVQATAHMWQTQFPNAEISIKKSTFDGDQSVYAKQITITIPNVVTDVAPPESGVFPRSQYRPSEFEMEKIKIAPPKLK